MIYSYQAKDQAGRTVTGSLDAPDERRAAQEIRDMGYFPMRLAPQQGGAATLTPQNGALWNGTPPQRATRARPAMPVGRWLLAHLVYPIWSGVGLRDLALLYRQFSAMLNAGVPIYQCLTSLTQQASNGRLRNYLGKISARVLQGEMLTEALAEFPWVFTDFHRAMIAAGEKSGRLDVMMSRLASALEQEYALRAVIKREMTYPVSVLVASFLVPPVVFLVVRHDVRMYFQLAILPLLESGAVVFAIYVLTRLASQFKAFYDGLIANLPAVGGVVRMIALARFSRVMASLYAAGVSIPEALRAAAAATGNAYMERRMVSAIPALQDGRGIAEALVATRIFPPMVVSMLGTGEQTGSLDMTMDKVAEYYEQESAVRLHQLCVSLGAIVTVIVGFRILVILIQFYTGYANQMNNMADPDGN
jgi:type IV pilus assembly protein PilC